MRVFDKELAQIKGTVIDKLAEQVATAMAKRIDSDLGAAMDADAVYLSPVAAANAITPAELQAGLANFGDDVDTDTFAGIIINSRLLPSFLGMDEFVSTNKTYQDAAQRNGIIVDGIVGTYLGINVILSNNGTYDSTAAECKTYIVKKDSLSYVFQREISVEEEREAKLLASDIVASSLYATKLLDDGVVVLKKTLPDTLVALTLTSVAGSSTGKTKVTVSIPLHVGYSAVYKTGSGLDMPDYDDVLTTGWTAFAAGTDITATTDNDLIVAYIKTSDNKAKFAGKVTVVSAA